MISFAEAVLRHATKIVPRGFSLGSHNPTHKWGFSPWGTLFVCAASFFFFPTSKAQTPASPARPVPLTSDLRIHVTDSEGAIVGTTLLFIHAVAAYDNQSQQSKNFPADQSISTDKTGDLTLPLQPAFYDVCAFAGGFAATCKTLLVSPNKTSTIKIVMKFDPFLCKYFCDSFPESSQKGKPKTH